MDPKIAAAMRSIDVVQRECQRLIAEMIKPGCDTQKLTADLQEMQKQLAILDQQLEALYPQSVKVIDQADITHVALTGRGFELGGYKK